METATLYTVLYGKQALPRTGLQVLWPIQGVGEDWLGGLHAGPYCWCPNSPLFHISQLKPFVLDNTSVYGTLLVTTDLESAAITPEAVIDCRLVKKGNTLVPQVCVTWIGLPGSSTTWE